MAVAPGEVEVNETAARSVAAQAAGEGVDVLILPEMWPTGYDLERAREYATPLGSGPFGLMAGLAREHKLHVIGTALEENRDGRPFNTAALYSPDGNLVAAYRKLHLWAPLGEAEHMTAGGELPLFDLPWGRMALAICYDLRFPEMWRAYAGAGARLVVIPAAWPSRRVEHWRVLLRARAIENQCFVLGCNRAGGGWDAGEDCFGGYSAVVDPWGRVLAEGGPEPGLVIAHLNLDEVENVRRLFPFWADRRRDVYERAR
ncbi:MAG: carbon-nitrogen family hydrolase [Anaerolineae bacterium]|nr:carbon-nitrogen family hydrolase [Anaerolineae bacterium]